MLVVHDFGDADLLVVPITSHAARGATDVPLSDWRGAGLKLPSTVRVEKLATIGKTCVARKVGALLPGDRVNVKGTLASVFRQMRLLLNTNGWAEVMTKDAPNSHVRLGLGTNVSALEFSSQGAVLAVGRDDGRVELWSPATARRLKDLEPARVGIGVPAIGYNRPLAISEDCGRLAAITTDERVQVWDVQTGRITFRPDLNCGAATSLALHDTARLAVGSFEGGIEVWDIPTRARLFDARAHRAAIWSLAFAPDGKHLATSSIDARLKIFEMATGKVLAQLRADRNSIDFVAYSPDGQRLIATGGSVYLFETQQFQAVARLKSRFDSWAKAWITETGNLIIDDSRGVEILTAPPLAEIEATMR